MYFIFWVVPLFLVMVGSFGLMCVVGYTHFHLPPAELSFEQAMQYQLDWTHIKQFLQLFGAFIVSAFAWSSS